MRYAIFYAQRLVDRRAPLLAPIAAKEANSSSKRAHTGTQDGRDYDVSDLTNEVHTPVFLRAASTKM